MLPRHSANDSEAAHMEMNSPISKFPLLSMSYVLISIDSSLAMVFLFREMPFNL